MKTLFVVLVLLYGCLGTPLLKDLRGKFRFKIFRDIARKADDIITLDEKGNHFIEDLFPETHDDPETKSTLKATTTTTPVVVGEEAEETEKPKEIPEEAIEEGPIPEEEIFPDTNDEENKEVSELSKETTGKEKNEELENEEESEEEGHKKEPADSNVPPPWSFPQEEEQAEKRWDVIPEGVDYQHVNKDVNEDVEEDVNEDVEEDSKVTQETETPVFTFVEEPGEENHREVEYVLPDETHVNLSEEEINKEKSYDKTQPEKAMKEGEGQKEDDEQGEDESYHDNYEKHHGRHKHHRGHHKHHRGHHKHHRGHHKHHRGHHKNHHGDHGNHHSGNKNQTVHHKHQHGHENNERKEEFTSTEKPQIKIQEEEQ